MAERDSVPFLTVDPLELEINKYFNGIISKINERRISLLTELRERREESRARDTQREEMISQIAITKSQVEAGLKENPLKQMQQKMIKEMEKELEKLKITPQSKEFRFSINSEFIEHALETLGEITELNVQVDYHAFQPVVAVAKAGKAPGELDGPEGVAIDESSGNIFVAELSDSRISVFSQTGEFIKYFDPDCFRQPWGMAIRNDDVFVSDVGNDAIFHFNLTNMELIRNVGKNGSGKLEFSNPSQLCIALNGDIYVCDRDNNRIQVLTSELEFRSIFKHESLSNPIDIKLRKELMYILSNYDNPCFHIFTLNGDKIRSIISRGEGLQLSNPLFFCLDANANIVVSDYDNDSIKVFTPEGEFIHQIGQQGHEKGMFFSPRGLFLTNEGNLICVSDNENFGLQIFS